MQAVPFADMELGFVLLWLTLLEGIAPVASAAQVKSGTRMWPDQFVHSRAGGGVSLVRVVLLVLSLLFDVRSRNNSHDSLYSLIPYWPEFFY